MKSIHQLAVWLLVVAGALGAGLAHAEDVRWEVHGRVLTRHILLRAGGTTTITLSSPVVEATPPSDWKVDMEVRTADSVILLRPPPDATPEELSGTLSLMTRHFTAILITGAARSAKEENRVVEIYHLADREIFDDAVSAKAAQIVDQRTAIQAKKQARKLAGLERRYAKKLSALEEQHAQEKAALEEQHARDKAALEARYARRIEALERRIAELTAGIAALVARRAEELEEARQATALATAERVRRERLRELLEGRRSEPVADHLGPGMRLHFVTWTKLGRDRVMIFEIENRRFRAYHVGSLVLLDQHKASDHAGTLQIGAEAPSEDRPDGVLAVIPPRTRVPASVVLRDPATAGTHVTLMMSATQDPAPIMSQPISVLDLTPPPPENEGRMTVSMQGIYGVIWLADGTTLGKLDATSIRGLGARFTYGLTRRLNLEIDALYASTGQGRFEQADMTGALIHSAQLGRIQGSLMARFGEHTFRPFVRMGVGVQGATHSAWTDRDGARTPGPEIPFSLDVLWPFGGGLEIHVGRRLVLGLGVAAVLASRSITEQSTSSGSIEGGVHLGYSWKP